MFYDILDQIMEFKMFLISTRQCRLAPLLLFYFNDSLFSETRIDKFGSLNIKKQTYLGLIYGLGQKIIFQAKSCNSKHFSIYAPMLHLPQVAVDMVIMNAVSSGP